MEGVLATITVQVSPNSFSTNFLIKVERFTVEVVNLKAREIAYLIKYFMWGVFIEDH